MEPSSLGCTNIAEFVKKRGYITRAWGERSDGWKVGVRSFVLMIVDVDVCNRRTVMKGNMLSCKILCRLIAFIRGYYENVVRHSHICAYL